MKIVFANIDNNLELELPDELGKLLWQFVQMRQVKTRWFKTFTNGRKIKYMVFDEGLDKLEEKK